MKILLIIPAYNEEESIENTIDTVKKYAENSSLNIDYIVINDGSTDSTGDILVNKGINHVTLINNLGIGGAVQTGYKYAYYNNYDIAVQFDGDGQHDINSLENLIDEVVKGNLDFCVGTRFGENKSDFQSTFARRLGINYLSNFLRILSSGNVKISDPTSGYRAANKNVINFFKDEYPIDYPEPESIMSLARKNLKLGEVSVNMFERTGGKSSIGAWDSVYYMIKVSIAIIFDRFFKVK